MELKDLRLVPCYFEYWEFVRNLRNNPKVSDGFIKQDYITTDMQTKYMSKFWEYYFICIWKTKHGFVPVGYVGIIDNDIRVCVDPDYQRMGIGKFMINYIKDDYPNAIAKVKIDNISSVKLFESCGFKSKYILMEQNR